MALSGYVWAVWASARSKSRSKKQQGSREEPPLGLVIACSRSLRKRLVTWHWAKPIFAIMKIIINVIIRYYCLFTYLLYIYWFTYIVIYLLSLLLSFLLIITMSLLSLLSLLLIISNYHYYYCYHCYYLYLMCIITLYMYQVLIMSCSDLKAQRGCQERCPLSKFACCKTPTC